MPAKATSLDCKRWYVVQTYTGREQVALAHLAHQHFEAFCPTRVKSSRRGRKKVRVNAPYFPGYLFVSLNLDTDRWNSINGTIGVIHLLASGTAGRPTPLPPDFVEHLQFNDSNAGAASELRAGQQVRVIGGPLDHRWGVKRT